MELRKDYILDRYVIIAESRGKRPHEFKKESSTEEENSNCFFCPGNEEKTPPEISRRRREGKWQIRVFPNKFSAVGKGEALELQTHNKFFTFADAVGSHEVIVETPNHSEDFWDFSLEKVYEIFDVYRERIVYLKEGKNTLYVCVFKNHGEEAGASIRHSHSQIISYNIVPNEVAKKEEFCSGYDGCPYCDIILAEKDSDRLIFKDENVVCFSPYASRFLFEVWLMPRRHVIGIEDLNSGELRSLSNALLKVTRKLKELSAPYNFYIQYGLRDMHFHIEIAPRLTKWAGFELATGTIINPVSPEKSASFYRGDN